MAALLAAAAASGADPTPAPPAEPDGSPKAVAKAAAPPLPDEVADLLETADASLASRNFKAAIKTYRQADKLMPAGCFLCQLGLAKAFNGIQASRDALKSIDKVLALTTDRRYHRVAYNEQGLALLALAGDDTAKLQEAEAAFRRSIAIGESAMGYLNLGLTLLRQARDPEGVAALEKFLDLEPDSPHAARAKELIANPLRARKRLVPDLELVSLSGEYVTTEELRGKVVLLDFWGTWCAPCRAAIPDLRNLSARLKKSPFVLISISNDPDAELLKRFVADNRMDWLQVWDENREINGRLAIRSYPTYVLVDHEGEIVFVTSGWGPVIEREIERRVGGAVGRAKRSVAAQP
jgi:thiol-disulfide isomerase/thioredoxin